MKKLFSLTFLLSFLMPTLALAADSFPKNIQEHTVQGDLTSFVEAFRALINKNPDVGAFVGHLIDSLPLFGLIVIVFGLMFFIGKITIFKDPDHDKYARMIAFGVALLGLVQQSVYDAILNLSTVFLILAFIVAIVFMFIMFVNYNRKKHLESHTELHTTTAKALTERMGLTKVKRQSEKLENELRRDRKHEKRIDADLANLDSSLRSISKLSGNELHQIDHVAELLRKATAAASKGSESQVHEYVDTLSRDLGSLVTTMKHEQGEFHKLNHIVADIDRELAKWNYDAKQESNEEQRIIRLFKQMHASQGHNLTDDEVKRILTKNSSFVHELRKLQTALHHLIAMKDELTKRIEHLDNFDYEKKHLEAQQVRDNILSKQFGEAHKHLDNLRSMVEQEHSLADSIGRFDTDLEHHLSKVSAAENHLTTLAKTEIGMIRRARSVAEQEADNS